MATVTHRLAPWPSSSRRRSAETLGAGCLTLTTPEGDRLFATYDLTQGQPNANNFVTDGSGTLIFTGGTGLFKGAEGKAAFTAVFGQGIGFYIIDGKVSAGRGD